MMMIFQRKTSTLLFLFLWSIFFTISLVVVNVPFLYFVASKIFLETSVTFFTSKIRNYLVFITLSVN